MEEEFDIYDALRKMAQGDLVTRAVSDLYYNMPSPDTIDCYYKEDNNSHSTYTVANWIDHNKGRIFFRFVFPDKKGTPVYIDRPVQWSEPDDVCRYLSIKDIKTNKKGYFITLSDCVGNAIQVNDKYYLFECFIYIADSGTEIYSDAPKGGLEGIYQSYPTSVRFNRISYEKFETSLHPAV